MTGVVEPLEIQGFMPGELVPPSEGRSVYDVTFALSRVPTDYEADRLLHWWGQLASGRLRCHDRRLILFNTTIEAVVGAAEDLVATIDHANQDAATYLAMQAEQLENERLAALPFEERVAAIADKIDWRTGKPKA